MVVQLVRTLPCHGRGRGFESRPSKIYPYTFQNTHTPNFGVGDEWKVWIFPQGLPLHQNWCWGLMPGGEGVWIYFLLSKARHTELMQYLLPCLPAGRRLSLGPSSKTCPKCAPQSLHLTSVRLASFLFFFPPFIFF